MGSDPIATRRGTVITFDGDRDGPAPGVGLLGMRWFVASLGVLFAASVVGYLAVRVPAEEWPPPGAAPLPATLWWSTAVILAGTVTIQAALHAIRRGRTRTLELGLLATLVLGLVFLALQGVNWAQLVDAEVTASSDLFGFTFFVLTGLHAAHVVGGLVPLVVVSVRAFLGRYHWASYAGVRYVTLYWHFLTVVWLVLFGLLYVVG